MDYTILIKTIVAALVGFITYTLGRPDMWLGALVIVIVADYITGLCKAWILCELSSKQGLKGIVKKLMCFAIVAVAMVVDNMTSAGGVVRITVISFLIANESISILENCADANLPVPKYLVKLLNKMKGNGDC